MRSSTTGPVPCPGPSPPDSEADQLLRSLDRMSPEDLAALKAKLAAMDAAEDPHGKPES